MVSTSTNTNNIGDDSINTNNDIYKQLDQFEHSLDSEIQDLKSLTTNLDEKKNSHSIAADTAEKVVESSGGGDMSNDIASSISSNSVDTEKFHEELECDEFVPPPSAWFALDDKYIEENNGDGSSGTRSPAAVAVHHEINYRVHQIQQSSSEESGSPSYKANGREQQLELPEYNSEDSQLFDLPIQTISSHSNDDVPISSQLTSVTTSLTNASTILLLPSITSLLHLSSKTLTSLSQSIPILLNEYTTSALSKSIHKLRIEYNKYGPQKYLRASDIGNVSGRGYYFATSTTTSTSNTDDDDSVNDEITMETIKQNSIVIGTSQSKDEHLDQLCLSSGETVQFTTLPWIERQLVHEWRTYEWKTRTKENGVEEKNTSSDQQIEGYQDNTCKGEDEDLDCIDSNEYERARTIAPRPLPKPQWEKATSCYSCQQIFSPSLHRHHCRRCGHSYCNAHSNHVHKLPHLGYDCTVPERVCKSCKVVLDSRDLEERVSWRLARCRDYLDGELTPYFETGVDTVEDVAKRITRLAISLARKIPLGAQAYVALETVEVLRKHGLKGVYGLLLRKEFLAAADLLCRVLGINKKNWPLSVHELSAAIFYALAQHRALRGVRPDGEEMIHSLKVASKNDNIDQDDSPYKKSLVSTPSSSQPSLPVVHEDHVVESENEQDDDEAGDTVVYEGHHNSILDETDVYDPSSEKVVDLLTMSVSKTANHASKSSGEGQMKENASEEAKAVGHGEGTKDNTATTTQTNLPFDPVCEHVPNTLISSLLFYAPLALDFIYAECEVDMQLLAAQQGWRLVYASLDQNHHHTTDGTEGSLDMNNENFSDKPASALFAHDEQKIACFSIRGTASIQDVVTDIRATPVPFPQEEEKEDLGSKDVDSTHSDKSEEESWTSIFQGSGLALCGMAGAAENLFKEAIDSLLYLALSGYKIRIVGHSLGGGVASLLGLLVLRHFEKQGMSSSINEDGFVRVFSYGTPSCVDARLADHPLTLDLCTSVVLHDDVVPRLTPTSVRGLLKHLLYIRETWVKTHLSDDLNAITERAYHVWPERIRGSFTLMKKKGVQSAKRLKKSCKKRIQNGQTKSPRSFDDGDEFTNPTDEMSDDTSDDEGLDVEGELFYDPLDRPINESDDESSVESRKDMSNDDWVPFDEPPMESDIITEPSTAIENDIDLPKEIDEEEEFDGYALRDCIFAKYGVCFDVEFQRVDSYGFRTVYLVSCYAVYVHMI